MTASRALRGSLVVASVTCALAPAVLAQDGGPHVVILQSTHSRKVCAKDIQRVAVGDTKIASVQVLNARELLILGEQPGQTSLMIWYTDGSFEQATYAVRRDLSVLAAAIKEIHPGITVEAAPDRDAVVLRGVVPELGLARAAEALAARYLGAVFSGVRGAAAPLVKAPGESAEKPGVTPEVVRMGNEPPVTSAVVINLIRLEHLPSRLEDRIGQAISTTGIAAVGSVSVKRLQKGPLPDDEQDVFLLEGKVPSQVALSRVLSVAARTVTGEQNAAGTDEVRVVADEAGALYRRGGVQQAATASLNGFGSLGGGSGSSSSNNQLSNRIGSNIGRAKILETAHGRVLSFVEVADLPQVRVAVRIYEVNRTKLSTLSFDPQAINTDFDANGLNPSTLATALQGNVTRVGATPRFFQGPPRIDARNIFSFLESGLGNETQLAGRRFAINMVFNYLETEGIARSLSSPTLTVLSGEIAQFQAGGEVPVPEAFVPPVTPQPGSSGATVGATGVFSSVSFRSFGVQLAVRPLAGEDGTITLDVLPQVVTPDPNLTAQIRQSTGTSLASTAFQSRGVLTSSRLQDGQALLIGGLVTRGTSGDASYIPWLHKVPLLGLLFERTRSSDNDLDLVVVLDPTIIRESNPAAAVWAFPDELELARSALRPKKKDAKEDK
jgi:Flp pilus assembly secretin CpaC